MAGTWRRVSDWKTSVTLVRFAEVPPAFMQERELVPPAERAREDAPRLTALLEETGFVRIGGALAKELERAGVTTWTVGYHRGSDGLEFRLGSDGRGVDMGALVSTMLDDKDDDEAFDRLRDDAVDAVLRLLSEGELTERAVLLATLFPPLTHDDVELDPELAALEAEGGAGLPSVSGDFVDLVARAFARLESTPRKPPGPILTADQRRRYIRQATVLGGATTIVTVVTLVWTPWVAVFAAPILVLSATVIAIHALALRQLRSIG